VISPRCTGSPYPVFRGHADNRHFASLSMDFSFQGQEASADSSSQDLRTTAYRLS
jgi:hypothetical protein